MDTKNRAGLPALILSVITSLSILGCQGGAPQAGTIPAASGARTLIPPNGAVSATAPAPRLAAASPGAPTTAAAAPTTLPPAASPTAIPSPTATPTLSPTPTLAPAALWPLARRASGDGDYAAAIPWWEEALRRSVPAERAEAGLALAEAYVEEGRREEALALLERLAAELSTTNDLAGVWSRLAVLREASGDWRGAIAAYEQVLSLDDAASLEVRWRIAKAHVALNEDAQAIETLRAIALPDVPASRRAEMLEEMAMAQRRGQAYDEALATYQSILAFAANPAYRALLQYRVGETLRDAGRTEEAVAQLATLVREQPTTQAAYLALTALDALGRADASDPARAEILYAAGQYDAAIEATQRHLSAAGKSAQGDRAQAYYTLGQSYQQLDQYEAAFASFDVVIEEFPADPLAPEAWMAKAQAARANGGDPSGFYHEMARLYPQHKRAPEALWLAAVYQERAGEWPEAASYYRRLAAEYPADSRVPEARFRAGLASYALGDAAAARQAWEALPAAALDAQGQARRLFWLAWAARKGGDEARARQTWEEVQRAQPEGYYGLRARDLLAGAPLALPDEPPAAPEQAPQEADWAEIAAWVDGWSAPPAPTGTAESATAGASTTPVSPTTAASATPLATVTAEATPSPLPGPALAQDPLAQRAAALARLGWHAEAQDAYRQLRAEVWNDAPAVLALARLAVERDEHAQTIACADRLLALGRAAGAPAPPPALRRLAYPSTYGRLVNAEAQAHGFDPLLFLALMRQESRFDPRALSYAGARGLAQVMPDTGTWIAGKVDLDGYRHDLLYRPQVSIRLGAWYLGWLLEENEGDWIAALVGYNAGPGNLQRMTGGEPIGDYDLFYETISIAQTKAYVEHIYTQYRLYQQVYGP